MDKTDIVDRLEAKVHRGRYTMGGGSISSDPAKSKTWGGEPILELANPDGPEAAAEIRRLRAVVAMCVNRIERPEMSPDANVIIERCRTALAGEGKP